MDTSPFLFAKVMSTTAIFAVSTAAAALSSAWGIWAARAAASMVGGADGVGLAGVETVANGDCALVAVDGLEGAVVRGDGDTESGVRGGSVAGLAARSVQAARVTVRNAAAPQRRTVIVAPYRCFPALRSGCPQAPKLGTPTLGQLPKE